jgi:transposase
VRKPQVIPDEDHEVIYERVAAVEVAKASGVVCMRAPDTKRPGPYVNRVWDNVPATRARIAELGRELLRGQVQIVTLESTDYWKPVYFLLEREGLDCLLYQASQVKALPGRPKTAGLRLAGQDHRAGVTGGQLRAAGGHPPAAHAHPLP